MTPETIALKLKVSSIVLCWALMVSAGASATARYPLKFGPIFEQAWARAEPEFGSNIGQVYLTIHNKSDAGDYLLAVDSSYSNSSMIHEASQQPVPGGLMMPSHGEVIMRPDGSSAQRIDRRLTQSVVKGSSKCEE